MTLNAKNPLSNKLIKIVQDNIKIDKLFVTEIQDMTFKIFVYRVM